MNSSLMSILILAGIAIFLIMRLRSVLGTRDGFEPDEPAQSTAPTTRRDFEVIEGGPDYDIVDHVEDDSDSAKALADMKRVEPSFMVSEFLTGARGAYEMILMGFERGEIEELEPFLSDDVYQTFEEVVADRNAQGLKIEAEFVGVRETTLSEARFDTSKNWAEISVRFVGELTSVVKNAEDEVVEGSSTTIKKQKDIWTFARTMGADDPNWQLIATDE